ncbi:MAG TPA: S-adenosylmethionine decarboxylase [Pyrinomonadaceae bacterium]|nr:S-adenosylmethionine decarboxylase [Pyrinomonadaceae bacterium]
MFVGTEWLIEAEGCKAEILANNETIERILEDVIHDLGLKPLNRFWHSFISPPGITGLIALTESHLACHTYPELGIATFNLFCCRERPDWPWEQELKKRLLASEVKISKIQRGESAGKSAAFAESSQNQFTGGIGE